MTLSQLAHHVAHETPGGRSLPCFLSITLLTPSFTHSTLHRFAPLLSFGGLRPRHSRHSQWFGFSNAAEEALGDNGGGNNCFEARCIYSEGCSDINGNGTYFTIITIMMCVCSFCVFFYTMSVMSKMKRKKKLTRNATSTAMVFNALSSVMWLPISLGYSLAIWLGNWHISDNMASASIPFLFSFIGIAYMNISIIWIQVASASKSMRQASSNLSKKAWLYVAVTSVLIVVVMMTLCVSSQFGMALSTLCAEIMYLQLRFRYSMGCLLHCVVRCGVNEGFSLDVLSGS